MSRVIRKQKAIKIVFTHIKCIKHSFEIKFGLIEPLGHQNLGLQSFSTDSKAFGFKQYYCKLQTYCTMYTIKKCK